MLSSCAAAAVVCSHDHDVWNSLIPASGNEFSQHAAKTVMNAPDGVLRAKGVLYVRVTMLLMARRKKAYLHLFANISFAGFFVVAVDVLQY